MYYDLNSVNPYIRIARKSIIAAGNDINRRIIFDYELIYIDDGKFTLMYDDKFYECSEGQFIFLRPGIPHSFNNIRHNLSQPHIHFDIKYSVNSVKTPISFKDFKDMSDDEKKLIQNDIFAEYSKTPFVEFKNKQKVLALFYEIVSESGYTSLVKKAKLMQIIDMLVEDNYPNFFNLSQSEPNIAQQIKDFIDSKQGVTVSLADMEKQFSYSRFHLERKFKGEFGVSIISYRNAKRMEQAKHLLKSKSVREVSEKLGFSSIYVFSRAFKNHFKIAPLAYKKSKKPKVL